MSKNITYVHASWLSCIRIYIYILNSARFAGIPNSAKFT